MEMNVTKVKWFEFHKRITDWQKRRYDDQLALAERAKERSIRILQARYGYTREQAEIELHKHYSKAKLY